MKRVEAIASGRVQGVNFRRHVQKAAAGHVVRGYVRNLGSGDVEIVAEGSEAELRSFLAAVMKAKPPIDVQSIEVRCLEPSGEFDSFEILR